MTRDADSVVLIVAFLAETSILRDREDSVGRGQALNTDSDVSGDIAFLAEGIGLAVGFSTVSVRKSRVARSTIAGLVSDFIISNDSVFAGITVLTESGSSTFLAFGVAFSAGDLVGGIDELIEATGAEALTVDEGSVVFGEARCAGCGVGAGLADGIACSAFGDSSIIETIGTVAVSV